MGLFDFLKSKPSTPAFSVRDLVWIDQSAKLLGCVSSLRENKHAKLLAWSETTQQQFDQQLVTHGLSKKVSLVSGILPSRLEGKTLYMLDHHLYATEEADFLAAANPAEVIFFVSVDDPLLQLFGNERLKTLMQNMGAEPREVFEHRMISKSIRRAQEQCEKQRGSLTIPDGIYDWWRGIH